MVSYTKCHDELLPLQLLYTVFANFKKSNNDNGIIIVIFE